MGRRPETSGRAAAALVPAPVAAAARRRELHGDERDGLGGAGDVPQLDVAVGAKRGEEKPGRRRVRGVPPGRRHLHHGSDGPRARESGSRAEGDDVPQPRERRGLELRARCEIVGEGVEEGDSTADAAECHHLGSDGADAGDALEGLERGWIVDGGDVGGADGREGCLRATPRRRLELRGVRRADDVHVPRDVRHHDAHARADALSRRGVGVRLDDRGDREELAREDDAQRVRARAPDARARRLRESQRRAVAVADGPREQPPLFPVRADQLDAAGGVGVRRPHARVGAPRGAYRARRGVLLEEHLRETRPVTRGGHHGGALDLAPQRILGFFFKNLERERSPAAQQRQKADSEEGPWPRYTLYVI